MYVAILRANPDADSVFTDIQLNIAISLYLMISTAIKPGSHLMFATVAPTLISAPLSNAFIMPKKLSNNTKKICLILGLALT